MSMNNQTTIWAISWLSFLWSVSSLMVFSILPAFLVDELKVGHADVGLIEGLAISSSFAAKFFSGIISDVMKKRKPLIMVGTIMTAIIKPLFALSSGAYMIFGVRLTDRLAKGIRSAPADALVADLSENKLYATNFGLRQSLYIGGEVVGAVLAMLIMLLSNNNYRLVFALSFIPALMAVLVLWLLVKPRPDSHPRAQSQSLYQLNLSHFRKFSPAFWWLMLACFFLMLARFSEAFLTLKAKESGWAVAYLPAMFIIYNVVHACIALPAGRYADKFSRNAMLLVGLVLMIIAQCLMSYVSSITGIVVGIIFIGLHMGVSQGLIKALIAETTPPELRGSAFSMFFVVGGFALFLGNVIAGQLSDTFGLYASFVGGTIFTTIAAAMLYAAFLKPRKLVSA